MRSNHVMIKTTIMIEMKKEGFYFLFFLIGFHHVHKHRNTHRSKLTVAIIILPPHTTPQLPAHFNRATHLSWLYVYRETPCLQLQLCAQWHAPVKHTFGQSDMYCAAIHVIDDDDDDETIHACLWNSTTSIVIIK